MKNQPMLVLSRGTFKSYRNLSDQTILDLFTEYEELGTAPSVFAQRDTPEQKALLVQIIKLFPGKIQRHSDNKVLSKKQAINRVVNYQANDI